MQCDRGSRSKSGFFYLPGNPPRLSGDLLRQESEFESQQGQEELSPNLNFLELMALSLKRGLVRLGEGQKEGRGGMRRRKRG